jgi:hypothetical protein
MGFFSLYIIIMNDDNGNYLDDQEIVDFNEELDARAAREMEKEEVPISPLMFGPSGRGSPVMELRPDHMLFRDAAKVRRNEGFKDDIYLEKPKLEPFTEQQQKEAEDEKRLDEMLDNMYKEMKKPAKSAVRPSSKKGGKRKRSTRSRVSRKRSRRNKRSRKGKSKRR